MMTDTCINYQIIMPPVLGEHLAFGDTGSVIYAMHHALELKNDHDTDAQDMRNMGGLARKMPITYVTMLIGALAISGVPIKSG